MGQQSWFIGSLFTPNIFVYSCFFVRRRAPGIPKASQSLPKASQSIPKASPKPPKASPKHPKSLPKPPQSLPRLPQALKEAPQTPPEPKCDPIMLLPPGDIQLWGLKHKLNLEAVYRSRNYSVLDLGGGWAICLVQISEKWTSRYWRISHIFQPILNDLNTPENCFFFESLAKLKE